jgi:hypothetical protein
MAVILDRHPAESATTSPADALEMVEETQPTVFVTGYDSIQQHSSNHLQRDFDEAECVACDRHRHSRLERHHAVLLARVRLDPVATAASPRLGQPRSRNGEQD